jgi:hypothetical protein
MSNTMITVNQRNYILEAAAEGETYRRRIISNVLGEMRDKIDEADIVTQFRLALFNGRRAYVDVKYPRFWDAQNLDSDPRLDLNKLLEEDDGYEQLTEQFRYVDIAHSVDVENIHLRIWFKPEKHEEVETPNRTLQALTPPPALIRVRRNLGTSFDAVDMDSE